MSHKSPTGHHAPYHRAGYLRRWGPFCRLPPSAPAAEQAAAAARTEPVEAPHHTAAAGERTFAADIAVGSLRRIVGRIAVVGRTWLADAVDLSISLVVELDQVGLDIQGNFEAFFDNITR